MPEWWNWQTHHLEGVALERVCGFESRLRHHFLSFSTPFLSDVAEGALCLERIRVENEKLKIELAELREGKPWSKE